MPPRRRIANFNTPVNPFAGMKAGNKDPRNFISGNVPGQQWDIEQQSVDRASIAARQPEQYSQRAHLGANRPAETTVLSLPVRINYVLWQKQQFTANLPTLLVPQNTRRLDIIYMPADIDVVFYSWGKPGFSSTGTPIGHRLPPGVPMPRTGDTVPINELWVWSPAAGETFVAYEGTDAPEANQ